MNSTDSEGVDDERYHTSNLYTSMEGSILCGSLSSFSVVASIVTISIILRSYDGLTSVYHRFFFCISVANILFSLPMALNTLMMPSDMPYTEFEGRHIGNQTTCNIQGLLFLYGITADFCYFTGLVLYYLCSITFKMLDTTFRKCIEPLIHAATCFVCVYASTVALVSNMINPSTRRNWCAREKLPFWCNGKDEYNIDDENYVVCIRGSSDAEEAMLKRFIIFFIFVVIAIILSMILIVISVYRLERSTSTVVSNQNTTMVGTPSLRGDVNSTKVISVQITAYLLSLMLFQTCSYTFGLTGPTNIALPTQIFFLVFGATHGVANFCIFVGHKVYNLKRAEQSLSFKSALWKVLMIRNESVFIFENVPDSIESNREMLLDKSESENDNKDQTQSLDPDPIRPAHTITMFHLNRSADQSDDWSLPTKENIAESINEDDLPSKNDLSSSIRFGESDQQSLDLSGIFGSKR
jgi:hypothetical protein